MDNVPGWNEYFMNIAKAVSLRSKDPITKVGALFVDKDNHILGCGYNGMPVGMKETPELWQRPIKYSHVLHAELNALSHSYNILNKYNEGNIKLYVTVYPCLTCMNVLTHGYKINSIFYSKLYSDSTEAMELAKENGIISIQVSI